MEKVLMSVIGIFITVQFILGFLFTCIHFRPGWTGWIGNKTIGGMVTERPVVPLSWENIVNARYQEAVASRFNDDFPGRELVMRVTDEFYYRLAGSSVIDTAPVLGKKRMLYEQVYLEEYLLNRTEHEKLVPLVDKLKRLQDLCARNGTAFTLVITPSKASIYPEYIPDEWMKHVDPQPRGYDLLVPMLKEQGIHFVDGHAILANTKLQSGQPLFPVGGIHWTWMGVVPVINGIAENLSAQGKAMEKIDISSVHATEVHSNFEGDGDMENLMNLAFRWKYPVSILQLKPRPIPDKAMTAAIVGGSFMWKIASGMSRTRQFSEIATYYYYKLQKRTFVDGGYHDIAEPVKSVNFAREILGADAVVLELNEQMIPGANHLNPFLDEVLASLPAKEPYLYESHLDYQWGRKISFDRNADARRQYYTLGFSATEENGTWTDGPSAEVLLHVPESSGDVRMRVAASAFLGKDGKQEVDVLVNEQVVVHWKFGKTEMETREVLIPAGLISGKNEIRIGFKIGHPVSPGELGQGKDRRKLGLYVAAISLDPIK